MTMNAIIEYPNHAVYSRAEEETFLRMKKKKKMKISSCEKTRNQTIKGASLGGLIGGNICKSCNRINLTKFNIKQ